MTNSFGIDIIPENDKQRIEALNRYKILNTPPEGGFDNVARLATQIFRVPISLISIVGAEEVFFKANIGMGDARSTSRGDSLCSLAVLKPEVTVFEDAANEPCLMANPNVAGKLGLKFYAGAPLITHDGYMIGTLCIIDKTPRDFPLEEQVILQGLAQVVMNEIEIRLSAIHENEKMLEINAQLVAGNEEIQASQALLKTGMDKLSASEAKLRYIVQDGPVAIAVLSGHDLVIESANRKMLEFWSAAQEVIGKPLLEALPDLMGQPVMQLFHAVFTSGRAFSSSELKAVLSRDNRPGDGYYDVVFQPLLDESGITHSIMIVANDVTEQITARKKAQQAEENLRIATESAELATWSLDSASGEFVSSPRLKQIFGLYADAEMPYEAVIEQVRPDYQDIVRDALGASIDKGDSFNIEYPIIERQEGKERWVRSLGKQISTRSESGRYITGILLDITEQKRDEQRKNDFIGMVSHELKTPLTSLTAYIQMLQGKAAKSKDDFTYGALEKANKQVGRMGTLINGFLNLSRLESGKIHIAKTKFDMAVLIREVEIETVENITTHQFLFEPVLRTIVEADQDKLSQVINNFLSNAVKYSPTGSVIRVSCVTNDGKAHVTVADQGMGIKSQDIEKLFDRYYRVENVQTRSIAGFGIGLYICSEIIQRHDGEIWVESEPGEGSRFHFTVPV